MFANVQTYLKKILRVLLKTCTKATEAPSG